MSAQTTDKMLADALDVAEKLSNQLKETQDMVIAVAKQTTQLAEFSRDKLDTAIIKIAKGDVLPATLILADLRIRFDKFAEANKGLTLKPTATGASPQGAEGT
jgi:hypothetical protein